MNWNCLANISQVVEAVFLAMTAVCGIIKYFYEKRIEKQKRTIEKVGELLEEYHKQFDEIGINTDYKKDVHFLSHVEQFCIAVESDVYCIETVQKYGSKFLSYLYDKYKDTVIANRRKSYADNKVINDNEVSYYYLEKLVKSFIQEVHHV